MAEKKLYENIRDYVDSDILPMHMPGHKRNLPEFLSALSAELDITEIADFDNLHSANGLLKESMHLAADVYSAHKSYFLVNGSTCGIAAAIYTLCRKGSKILVARNCHRSVYNSIELTGLEPCYIYPEYDNGFGIFTSIKPETVEKAISENPDAEVLILTFPTYEGICSDIEAICRIAHSSGVKVIVDSAHGAHFGFADGFPVSAVSCGADIVIQSLHKTLPSLTGTALAHISENVDSNMFEHSLSVFETSSPSYLFLSSIDGCIHWLNDCGKKEIEKWGRELDALYKKLEKLTKIKITYISPIDSAFDKDKSKICINVSDTGMNGYQFADILRKKYKIEAEMYTVNYVLLMTSPFDSEDAYDRVFYALSALDKYLIKQNANSVFCPNTDKPLIRMNPYDALRSEFRYVPLNEAEGHICAEYVIAYPPGIPIIVPGEIITASLIRYIEKIRKENRNLIFSGNEDNKIRIVI